MTNDFRNRLETELRRIADQLIRDADWKEALPWETLTTDGDSNYHFARSEGMYGGSAGIALFLLETGRYTNNPEYTDAAEKAITSIMEHCRQTPLSYYAFVTGRMSVSFVALRFFERTGKRDYLTAALDLAKNCKDFLTPHSADDFINGTSGTLLGLLLLHEASGEEWLLETADAFAAHLLAKAHSGRQGLYWDRTHRQIRGLCGFSHGASGIGFVFAEAAAYLRNPALNYVAEQAYLYEQQYFNPEIGNWEDFRKGIFQDKDQQEHEDHYRNGNKEFFTKGSFMNAWCHGAAGIGLARVRAEKLLAAEYHAEALDAIAMTYRTNVAFHSIETNFSLCHGGGGNADVFIEGYKAFGDETLLGYAETVAAMALEQIEQHGTYRSGFGMAAPSMEDRSLYMGIAGVGYFFLRLLDPLNVPSVEAPTLHTQATIARETIAHLPTLGAHIGTIRRSIVAKIFSRTLMAFDEYSPQTLETYFNQIPNNRIQELPLFIAFVRQFLSQSSEPASKTGKKPALQQITSHFHLENAMYELETSIESAAYLFIRTQMELKRVQEFLTQSSTLENHTVQIDTFARLVEMPNDSGVAYVLLAQPYGVVMQQLSSFGALVLSTFLEPHTVQEGINAIAEYIDHAPEQREQITNAALQQIHQLLQSGILHIA
jgi:hypothetical protein